MTFGYLSVPDAVLYWVSSQTWRWLLRSREVPFLGNEQVSGKQFITKNSDKSDQGKAQGAVKDPSRGYPISPGGGVTDELLEEAAFKLNLKEDQS